MKASIWLMPLYMRNFREFKTSKISASETPVILNLGTQMHRKHLLWHLKNFFYYSISYSLQLTRQSAFHQGGCEDADFWLVNYWSASSSYPTLPVYRCWKIIVMSISYSGTIHTFPEVKINRFFIFCHSSKLLLCRIKPIVVLFASQ